MKYMDTLLTCYAIKPYILISIEWDLNFQFNENSKPRSVDFLKTLFEVESKYDKILFLFLKMTFDLEESISNPLNAWNFHVKAENRCDIHGHIRVGILRIWYVFTKEFKRKGTERIGIHRVEHFYDCMRARIFTVDAMVLR